MNSRLFVVAMLPLGVAGCAAFTQSTEYYGADWKPPSLTGLSQASEQGNLGGDTIEIQGSGFGEDIDELVVLFGDDNAEIVSVTDSALTVVVPGGPITGGDVEVRVATRTGYSASPTPYRYEVGDLYDDQIGYVQVNNYWESCFGGLSSRLDDEYGDTPCGDAASVGSTGLSGSGEALTFAYPRLHAAAIGFYGGNDQGASQWKVERPSQLSYPFGVDELRQDVKAFSLLNEHTDEELDFCSAPTADGVPDYVYDADWTEAENFFNGGNRANPKPVQVRVLADGLFGDEPAVTLPESIIVSADEGFAPLFDGETSAGNLWPLSAIETCFDDDGNGEKLDDVAVTFSWAPSALTLEEGDLEWASGGRIKDHQTYVRVTMTSLTLNWFGGSSYPVRATVVVPDDNEYDRATGLSHLGIPASVLYQFPTVVYPAAPSFGGNVGLVDPAGQWGLLIVVVDRVTDYTLASDLNGDVVVSYTTGDVGYYEWTNPTDANGCQNCEDDDGDGYADEADPDCTNGTEELGATGAACNDGIDNDGDGRADGADALCEDADDEDESNCSDRDDNDEDGTVDADDADCAAGGNEGDGAPPCENGLDDDADGWTDADDPDCASGADELGFGATECNDAGDNDSDGLVDAADPECVSAGGDEAAAISGCGNGLDDDSDGWTDVDDPDCLTGTDEVDFGTTQCNDGIDNDSDSGFDADDLECTDALDDDEAL